MSHPRKGRTVAGWPIVLCGLSLQAPPAAAWGETAAVQDRAPPARPAILFNRWQEDWSTLADPRIARAPGDSFKYIPLSAGDPKTYLSFGLGVRERFEANDAAGFGLGGERADDHVISRVEVHADLHLGAAVQVFTQLQSDFAPGKARLSPVDQDRLDLEQAFVAVTAPLAGGTLRLRLGRQQIAFDLQRFISVRDGPNVRQSYDALWADYEHGPWRLTAFYSQPVQARDARAFDDASSTRLTYGGARLERRVFGASALSLSVGRFHQAGAVYPGASGDERRTVVDARFAGAAGGVDWDAEAMGQTGRVGTKDVRAWAVGSLAGYSFKAAPWGPRFGLQLDAASGDRDPTDRTVETFKPLFPNGYYVTLAGYTGYVNFIHLKPSVTLHPTRSLKLMIAGAAQWRATTADAVYTQPNIPTPGTAGRPGRFTGSYAQFRADWAASAHLAFALEAVHLNVGQAISRAGGRDSNYLGAEMKWGW